jgi:hypothetical protein
MNLKLLISNQIRKHSMKEATVASRRRVFSREHCRVSHRQLASDVMFISAQIIIY